MKYYGFVFYRNAIYLVEAAFDSPQEAIEAASKLEVASKPNAMPNARGSRKGQQDVIDVLAADHWIATGKHLVVKAA